MGFAEPFTLPTKDYRVSVYVGDPNVEQTRVSYLAGQADGLVEKGDGTTWQIVGSSPASITVFGTAEITVPVAGLPPGSAVWVEAVSGAGLAQRQTLSPYFSYDSLVINPNNGKLGSSTWGYVGTSFGRAPGAVPMPDRGVVLSLVNKGLSLTYVDPVPGKVMGTQTAAVLDYIKIAPGRSQTGPRSDYIAVDRTTGTIKLFDASVSPPADVSDRTNWLIEGFPSGSAGQPATLTFNMEAVAQALGFTITDDGVALGVDRAFSLEDGRVLTGVGVIGTVGWFNTATATTPPDLSIATPPSGGSSEESSATSTNKTPLIIGVAAAVGVLVILAIALGLRRRRRRREEEATGEFAWDSPSTAPSVAAAAAAPVVADAAAAVAGARARAGVRTGAGARCRGARARAGAGGRSRARARAGRRRRRGGLHAHAALARRCAGRARGRAAGDDRPARPPRRLVLRLVPVLVRRAEHALRDPVEALLLAFGRSVAAHLCGGCFADEPEVARQALGIDVAAGGSVLHGAARLGVVVAVAEAAVLGPLLDLGEREAESRVGLAQADASQSGRVDDDAAAG